MTCFSSLPSRWLRSLRNKGKRKKKTFEWKCPPFLFDRLSVSRLLSPLRWLAKRVLHPQKIGRVLNCATCFQPPNDAPHRLATRCDIQSHNRIAASKASCGIDFTLCGWQGLQSRDSSLSLSAGLERLTRPHNRKKNKKTTALSPSTPLAFYNTGRDPRNKTTFNLGIFKISNSVTSHSHLQMMSAKSQSFQDRSRAHPDDTRVGDRARIRQTADLPTRVRCHVRQTLWFKRHTLTFCRSFLYQLCIIMKLKSYACSESCAG